MSESVDVVVVDDILSAASAYSELIRVKTGLIVAHTSNPSEALEVCRRNSIKVAVLDQRMPDISGTDLYQRMMQIDPSIRAIMLTGEASAQEVGAAIQLQFKKYLPKNEVRNLPDAVLGEYVAWQSESASRTLAADRPTIFERRTSLLSRNTVKYGVLRAEIVDPSHTFSDQWRDVVSLHAGQVERRQIQVDIGSSVVLEEETIDSLRTDLGVSTKHIASMTGKLQIELSQRFRETHTLTASSTQIVEQTFSLQEPTDLTQRHVKFRRILKAPIFSRVKIEIVTSCNCCSASSVNSLDAYIPTRRTALRQIDKYSDGTSEETDLGEVS
ncbi:response regulator [Streptomyces sp. NPDC050164]|uniref:response regulator n=1 Tax=Streptomyces sp. NPDC050164 TaxID=3365605 RepID=UPI0037A590B0